MFISANLGQGTTSTCRLVDQKNAGEAEVKKRKLEEHQGEYLQAKKKLKLLEDEAASCLKSSTKKAKDSLKKHDFGLLAQSVALKDKSDEIQKKIDEQKKLVDELKCNLVQ